MKYQVGDILFIAKTGFDYKIISVDERHYTLCKIKKNNTLGRNLYMSENDLENIFDTLKQQRKQKLNNLKNIE